MWILHFPGPSVFRLYLIVKKKEQGHVGHGAPRAWVSAWLWCHSMGREGGGTWDEKSGDGEFPGAIYLFTNCVTLCKPQECLAPCYKDVQLICHQVRDCKIRPEKTWQYRLDFLEWHWTDIPFSNISPGSSLDPLAPCGLPRETEAIISK